jgi:hypothetical protein
MNASRLRLTVPEVALIAGTRVVLGLGLGLLLADWMNQEQRRAAGWALAIVGGLTTIPLVAEVWGTQAIRGSRHAHGNGRPIALPETEVAVRHD